MMKSVQPSSLGLRRVKLLAGLDATAFETLARECAWRRYTAGQVLFTREAPGNEVFLIAAGRVRVTFYTASGKQVTFRDLGEGDTVGEVSAVDGGRRSADVVALSDVVAAAMTQAQFRALLKREPSVAEHFMAYQARLIRLLSDRVVELSTLGVQNRIHAEVLRLARESGNGAANQGLIAPAPRHVEIASRVSTTREQVTREMSALAKRNLVVKHQDGLFVTDMALLQRMVEQASLEA